MQNNGAGILSSAQGFFEAVHEISKAPGKQVLDAGSKSADGVGNCLNNSKLYLACWQYPFAVPRSKGLMSSPGTGFSLHVPLSGAWC